MKKAEIKRKSQWNERKNWSDRSLRALLLILLRIWNEWTAYQVLAWETFKEGRHVRCNLPPLTRVYETSNDGIYSYPRISNHDYICCACITSICICIYVYVSIPIERLCGSKVRLDGIVNSNSAAVAIILILNHSNMLQSPTLLIYTYIILY